jgi:hypothetical protein
VRPQRDAGDDPLWHSSTEVSPTARPSWLAPPFESQTLPIATRSMATEPEPLVPAPPSLRLVASLDPPNAPEVDFVVAPAISYPDLREENAALRAEAASLRAAVGEIRRAVLTASEGELVRLACTIAERVAGRELSLDPTLILGWIREATGTLAATEGFALVVSADLARLLDPSLLRGAAPGATTVEVDPALGSMRCEVRTHAARVVASLEDRLLSVARELGVSGE